MAVAPGLRLELLGGFRVFTDSRFASRAPSARQRELIAFLVLHARRSAVPRQRIAGALWPESNDAQALTNLRRELHHLRDAWPALEALIDVGSRTLAWRDDAGVRVDLVAFEQAADLGLAGDRSALSDAARLYQGELLPDLSAEWIEPDRERLRLRAKSVLLRLIATLEQERAYGGAIEHAQQLSRLDPLEEQAWCTLMRCHARRGDRATALHLYQQWAAILKRELGAQPSAAARATYREILNLDQAPPSPAPARSSVYPLVGRHAEFRILLNAWYAAASGRPSMVLVRGEAGIGKSRLAEELVDWCRLEAITAVTARCYAGEGRLAYAPIAAWLKSPALQPTLSTLDAAWLTDVARLRPELVSTRPDVARPDLQLESWQRLRFFESLGQAFRAAAPLVLVLDDLQWADADTIEWLQYLLRSASGSSFLVVATVRTEEEQDNPPLGRLLGQLQHDDLLTTIPLGPLDQSATALLAGAVAECTLDDAAQAQTFRDTEGHPLFIIERGRMELAGQTGTPAAVELSRVQSVVAARLALLSDEARATAEVAATVGRDFPFDLLASASDLEEPVLVRALDELWQRHIVRVQGDEHWDFSHDRIREVAYSGIGPARRRLIHRRIAQSMELLHAGRLDEVSASLAVHLDRGGQPARAVPFLERAAAVATRVSANEEAIHCLTYALSLLETLPATRERDEHELAIRSSLSVVLNSARGYASLDVEQNLDRVFALLRADGHRQLPVRWLWVAFTHRFMLGDLQGTRAASEQAFASSIGDPSCLCEAHHAMGGMLMSVGELDASRSHFEASLAAYDEQHPQRSALGSDLGVFAHAWFSHVLWLLGEDQLAVTHADRGIELARRRDHLFSQTIALAYGALLHQMRGDFTRVLEYAEAVVDLCRRYGFAYYGEWATVLLGWVRGQEDATRGIAMIESALERLDSQRAHARRPYHLSLLAETYCHAGQPARAASIVTSAIDMARARGDVWWLPALFLQKSELDRPADRQHTLRSGVDVARQQHSLSLLQRLKSALTAAT